MTIEKIREILDKHAKWMKGDPDGERANLRGADLYGANLRGANLRGADLRGANLYGADLRGADLRGADLRGADLYGANLYGADLRGGDLRGANLRGANLYGADLREAKVEYELMAKFFPLCCPETGSFTAWKKLAGDMIAKLTIPEDALRSSAYGRKCRASKAVVLSVVDANGNEVSEGFSQYNSNFRYAVGETVEVEDFDPNRWNECSTGIHFFITRQEAVDY